MLAATIVAAVIAAISAVIAGLALGHAKRSADAAKESLAEAKRSADAAEKSAGAAAVTAEADRAEDKRRREPQLTVAVDAMVEHNGQDAIYRVTNEGPVDLDSVVVHRPILGPVENGIVHPVARTGGGIYDDQAEIGPIAMGTYGRFTLSLGPGEKVPEFRVRIVSTAGVESWERVVLLNEARKPPPPPMPRSASVASPAELRRPRRNPARGYPEF
jgi:hypothetical protein